MSAEPNKPPHGVSTSPGDGVRIEPALPRHLPAIAALAGVIWRAHYPGIIPREQIEYMLARMYDLDTMRREMTGEGVRYLRLLCGEELIGFAASGSTAEPATAKLHKLYLRPDCQRRGLGGRLLRRVEDDARAAGVATLILNVNKRNAAAIAAYRKHGYAVRESVTLDIGGGFVMDDFVMAKALRG
jgi:ribosomal protein S18 acetylase RimI-like enzyme